MERVSQCIQLYPDTFDLFKIINIQLSSPVTELLMAVLKGRLNYTLSLTINEFKYPREGIEFAVELIKSSHNLKAFNWKDNQMGSTENGRYLVDAITNHPSINHVQLENCLAGINGYDAIKSLFTTKKHFSYIDLENNNMQTGGNTEIPDFIARNTPTTELYLGGNNLNDNDASLIAQALKQNTNLQHLDLQSNDLSVVGKKVLFNAIYDPTNLNTLSVCNHTCRLYLGLNLGERLDMENTSDKPRYNRSKKISHLLSIRNKEGSIVQHFNEEFGDEDDDSLKLVPKVLERISQLDKIEGRCSLSIMYEILRGWKMPELYDTKRGQEKTNRY